MLGGSSEMKTNRLLLVAAAVLGTVAPQRVRAQEPIFALDSATSPSPGHYILKHQFRWSSLSLENDPRDGRGDIEDYQFRTTLSRGITRDLSMSARFDLIARDRATPLSLDNRDTEQGIGDVTVLAKYRFYQDDSTGLNTRRLSAIGGMQFRSGDRPFTSDGYNPIVGLTYTQIAGRHGLNGAVSYLFTTNGVEDAVLAGQGDADLFRYDAAYLYRLSPEKYTVDTYGAFYGVLELNGYYETNGDHELLIAPGIMYEAAKWTAEIAVQLPLVQDIDHRARNEITVVAGIRFSF